MSGRDRQNLLTPLSANQTMMRGFTPIKHNHRLILTISYDADFIEKYARSIEMPSQLTRQALEAR
ncbi:hypothetical protein [Pontivivens ytuae]|uniref:Uncharacterized protein n=1 Tax=Pontivivens ytuae TaxID=2789856 RepID=A0A7S9LST5_9RHOB|nr:hypothetical protein [Pontivivens ytuae]QPH54506.1 hypothetical protein I0K15_01620 [Pontivivens ytuae]